MSLLRPGGRETKRERYIYRKGTTEIKRERNGLKGNDGSYRESEQYEGREGGLSNRMERRETVGRAETEIVGVV